MRESLSYIWRKKIEYVNDQTKYLRDQHFQSFFLIVSSPKHNNLVLKWLRYRTIHTHKVTLIPTFLKKTITLNRVIGPQYEEISLQSSSLYS